MKIPTPTLRALLLSLILGCSASKLHADIPDTALYATEFTNWEEIQWTDKQGKAIPYEADSSLTLGNPRVAESKSYTITLDKTERVDGLYLAERANWTFTGPKGVELHNGAGTFCTEGAVTLLIPLSSRVYTLNRGNSLIIEGNSCLYGQSLTATEAFASFKSGANTIFDVDLRSESRLSVSGSASLKIGAVMLANSTLETDGIIVAPLSKQTTASAPTLDWAQEGLADTVITKDGIECGQFLDAHIMIRDEGGTLSQCTFKGGLIEMGQPNSKLTLRDCYFQGDTSPTIKIAEKTVFHVENLHWDLSFEAKDIDMDEGMTTFNVRSITSGTELGEVSGAFHVHASFKGDALEQYKKLKTLGIRFDGLPINLVKFDIKKVTMNAEQGDTWIIQSIESDMDGNAYFTFKKK